MADAKKLLGGLGKVSERLLASGEELTAAQRAEAGRKAAALIKSQPQIKASEALGQQMEKGIKRTTTTQADRTRVGGGNIGGAPFSAISEADPAYAGKVWGVMDEGTAARLKNLTDPETAWTTMLGSANQLKTNPLVFEKLKRGFVDSMKQGNLSDELAGKINHNLALTFGEGADIRNPKIWREANTFEKRAALADVMMGQGTAPSKGGIAIGGEKSGKGVIFKPTDILKRETEPSLLHTEHGGDVPTFAAGPRLFKLEKESEYRPDLHPGFPTLLKGEDLGVNMMPTPTEVYLPDWHKKFKKDNPERKSPGYYDLALGVKGEGLPSQELNDEYIRHLLREGFKKGGSVDIDAADRRLSAAMAKRMSGGGMAKGGGVDIQASDARLEAAMNARMAQGGEVGFKKLEFMSDGGVPHMADAGKVVKGMAKIGKRLMSEEQVAGDAIGKAAESAGMKAPVTANKPLTDLQDFHTSFGDSVRKRAMDMQATMDSLNYKFDKGQRVFTEDSARKNWPPMTVLGRVLEGNRIMREDPSDFLSKKIIDEATGKAKRTPYEAGYKVRLEHAPDNWSEFVIPESAIKGNVDFARGGLAMAKGGAPAGGSIQDNLKNIQNYSVLNQGTPKKPNELGGVILSGASWMAGDEKTKLAKQAFGQDVTNTAVGGQKTSDVLNQLNVFERDGGTFAKGATVVLDIGANDIATGIDPNITRKNLEEIVSRLEDSGVNVILSGQPEAHSYDEAVKSTNLQMDNLYNEIAQNHPNVTLVDAMSGLLNQKDLMDESGFHLNSDDAKLSYLKQFADAYKGMNNQVQTGIPEQISQIAQTRNAVDIPQEIAQITQVDKPAERYTPEAQVDFMPAVIESERQPSAGYASAQQNQGLDTYYQDINKYVAENHSPEEIQQAMEFYGVSQADVDAARDFQPSGRGGIDESYATEQYADGGGAFKTIQWQEPQKFDGGGMAVDLSEPSEGSRREPLLTEKDWANIKRNAPEVYEWAKQNVKDEASQLKTGKGVKDFALRTGAQYLGGIPDLANLGLMGVDALANTKLSSEKPWFGSEQYIDAMRKAGMIGENEFPIAETVAGVLAPAGLIRKGIKKVRGFHAPKEELKKRRGGLAAMSR